MHSDSFRDNIASGNRINFSVVLIIGIIYKLTQRFGPCQLLQKVGYKNKVQDGEIMNFMSRNVYLKVI